MYNKRRFPKAVKGRTGWNKVAKSYDRHVGESGSDYHQNIIIPKALEMLKPRKGEKILDIGCGQGVFCRRLADLGVFASGVDSSEELIKLARQRSSNKIKFFLTDASDLSRLPETYDAATFILSLQNMENVNAVIKQASQVLNAGGRMLITLNHPCFRIPRQSGWGFDEKRKLQYRRVDSYMSEMKVPIKMHPGHDPEAITWSYHRPLSFYIRALCESGLLLKEMVELVSHRKSMPGERARAENRARDEIPLFLALLAVKIK